MLESQTVQASSQEVVHALYTEYGRGIVSKIQKMVGRWELAQEISQEVFIKLWQKGITFGSREEAFSWLYRCAHNAAIDCLRSSVSRHEGRAGIVVEDQHVDTSAHDRDLLGNCQVRDILKGFSERDAQILGFIAFDGMTHEETAAMVGISKKTVTRVVLRARELLQGSEI